MNNTIAEEFEKRQNIKAKTVTTINTGTRHDDAADALSEFARFKLREQNAIYGLDTGEGKDQSVNYYQVINDNPNLTKSSANKGAYGTPNYTTVKYTIPAFNDISENINKILEDKYIMESIDKTYIRDTEALYARELLNRLNKIIEYCDNWKIVDQVDYDIKPHMDYIVEVAKGKHNEK